MGASRPIDQAGLAASLGARIREPRKTRWRSTFCDFREARPSKQVRKVKADSTGISLDREARTADFFGGDCPSHLTARRVRQIFLEGIVLLT